ncbi:MAG: HD domain-containing protein [Deltaproteobacteria bacterium]|jgi:HD-GYP domain-containing protein (c-di-GMP phosphodiesterase class II)|nr:HD domain-containing protein [Deltaproteobacteria bacterium]
MALPSDKKPISDGEELLTSMFRLLQVVKIHQANNKLFVDNIEAFRVALKKLWLNGQPAEFILFRGRFYLNDQRIVYSAAMWNTVIKISEFFQERQIDGLKFFPYQDASDQTIVRLMDVLNRAKKEKSPYEWLAENLTADLAWVQATRERDHEKSVQNDQSPSDGPDGPEGVGRVNVSQELAIQARKAYSLALTVLRRSFNRLREKKKIGAQKAKRAVQELIDVLFSDESVFLALSTIRDGDDSLFTHSINTTILAIGLGHRLKLNRSALEQLGLAALFHDLGKAGAPLKAASAPERLGGRDLALAQSHVLNSLYHVIRLNATFPLKLALVGPTIEHHQSLDGSGYPKSKNPKNISLNGRILAIVDQYVAMTSSRPWRPELTPFEAIMVLLDKSATELDPILVKSFINLVGPWPVGSLLALNTKELAITKITPPDSEEGWPLAVLVSLGPDQRPIAGEVVNLGEKTPDGRLKRQILDCFHPSRFGIQPVDCLLGGQKFQNSPP